MLVYVHAYTAGVYEHIYLWLVVNRLYYVSEDTVHTAKRYPICLFLIDKFFVHRAGVRTSARLFFKRGA